MAIGTDRIGTWTPEHEFKVEADRTKEYAAATNDPAPVHLEGELAPPVFAVVPVWDTLTEALMSSVPEEVMLAVLHGEQDIRWHRPVRSGDVLRSRARVVGVQVKKSGTTVVTHCETRDADGELVVDQYFVTFFRGVTDGESSGDEAPDHKLTAEHKRDDAAASVTQHVDDDQTHRYASASGDHNPIHVDDEVARSVGLPGIINHGLCTMAFTSWAAIQELGGGDPARLRRLAVRFSQPVLPGQDITTTFWRREEHDGNAVYGFEIRNPDGELVIKDGLAEIAS